MDALPYCLVPKEVHHGCPTILFGPYRRCIMDALPYCLVPKEVHHGCPTILFGPYRRCIMDALPYCLVPIGGASWMPYHIVWSL